MLRTWVIWDTLLKILNFCTVVHDHKNIKWYFSEVLLRIRFTQWCTKMIFVEIYLQGKPVRILNPFGCLFLRILKTSFVFRMFFCPILPKPEYGLERGVWVSFIACCLMDRKFWKQSTCIFCSLWDRKYDHYIAMESLYWSGLGLITPLRTLKAFYFFSLFEVH